MHKEVSADILLHS